jgi:SAM-dependent methyltransferase
MNPAPPVTTSVFIVHKYGLPHIFHAMSDVYYPEEGNAWCAAVEDASWWFQHRNRAILDLIERYPPRTPFYDVGGGNGIVALSLKNAGIPAIVVEPGEAGVTRARERGLEAKHATLDTAGFAPASLGSIGMFDVVEHIKDDVGFLKQARSYLQPGGRLYLTVPAFQALWSGEDVYAEHFRRYTKGTMRRTLQAAGFEPEYVSYIFGFLPIPVLLFRTIPFRLNMNRPPSEQSMQSDHVGRSASRMVLDAMLGVERAAAKTLGGLPFGGSVIAVAKA